MSPFRNNCSWFSCIVCILREHIVLSMYSIIESYLSLNDSLKAPALLPMLSSYIVPALRWLKWGALQEGDCSWNVVWCLLYRASSVHYRTNQANKLTSWCGWNISSYTDLLAKLCLKCMNVFPTLAYDSETFFGLWALYFLALCMRREMGSYIATTVVKKKIQNRKRSE